MIEVHNLCKQYDQVQALDDVSLSIETGEVIGLLGPNGAGKTTLMKILTGYIQPSSGTAAIGGHDVLAETGKVQEMIGYLPENAPVYPELTVQSYLRMMADLRNIPKDRQIDAIREAVDAVGLRDRLTLPIGTLSKGYRQRVGLAQAILHKPRLLILDEPTNGLDPTQIVEVRRLIRKLAQDATILLSTHILPEVEATCDRAVIIIRGRLKADALLSELAATSHARLVLDRGADGEAVRAALAALDGVEAVREAAAGDNERAFEIQTATGTDICPRIFDLARDNNWPLRELRRETRTLEAVFNELTATEGGRQ